MVLQLLLLLYRENDVLHKGVIGALSAPPYFWDENERK